SVSKYSEEDITEAMNLLPHLSFQPPEVWSCPIADLEIDSMEETGDPVNPARLPDRIRFSPREYTDRLHSDGRIKRLLPIQDIKRKREYRETSLGVKEPDRVTRPPPEGLLSYKTIEGQRIDPMEIRALRDTIRFLRSRYPGSSSFSNMLGTIEKILKTGNGISSINQLRMVRRVLEDDKLCSKAWKRLKSIRLGSFHSLTYFQREHVKQLVSQYPDLMLITGNHLFLLILAAVHDRVGDLYRRTWELLWDYVFPWHLTGLGMCPTYPDDNPYGRSVLDRRTVLRRLRSRAIAINRLLDNEESPRKIRMGHLIIQPISGQRMPLWLIFQHATGSREMNAALLTPVRIDPTTNPQKVLTSLASGDTHWSESKIDRLSQFARPGEGDTATPIMVAEYRESDVLWILNQKETSWLPVGYIQYTTRKIEDVTLVRTITLRSGYNLEPIPLERVAEQTSKVESIVAIARLIVNKAFLECRNVTCHVSLDRENGKYHLGFSDSRADVQDDELGTLSAKRTSDVIELLRRPDADCEPVVINGEKLIWSRFTGIVYHGDARIIRPWVERKSPLKGSSFELPDSAEQIIHTKRVEVNLEVYHDADVCPLAGLSKKQINDFLIDIEENPNQYAAWADEMIGQPDVFLSESVHRHGICWGVTIRSNEDLPVIFDSLHFTRLGGPELGTLIKTGMLAHKTDSTWVIYEFVVPEVSSLPTEIKESIFLLNAYRDTVPKIMETIQVPRTYRLPREEMWKVHLSWREDEINWGATSQETDTSYSNTSFTIRLYPKKSLGVMLNEILGQITSNIPRKNILGFNDLRKDIISRLSKRGYEPENHFEIYLRKCDEGFEYSIEKVPKSWPSRTRWYTFVIEEEWELEEIQDSLMLELEGHGASDYEIVNQSDFIEN
ncbi:MAG: hypothetical protein ACQET3_13155, partial [Promethearchaeati archaeon]